MSYFKASNTTYKDFTPISLLFRVFAIATSTAKIHYLDLSIVKTNRLLRPTSFYPKQTIPCTVIKFRYSRFTINDIDHSLLFQMLVSNHKWNFTVYDFIFIYDMNYNAKLFHDLSRMTGQHGLSEKDYILIQTNSTFC